MSKNDIASQVIADAFFNYATMTYAFGGYSEAQRMAGTQKLFRRCVAAADKFGGIVTTPDNKGALIWLSGDYFPMGIVNEITSGMLAIPFEIGVKPTLRLMGHEQDSEVWIKKNSSGKMGYIWCVGVLEEMRGKGLSRVLIDHSIADMKAAGITDYWLKTEDPKNVEVYKKLGFEMKREIIVKQSGLPTWFFNKK
jgi:GNAT superfamily N-acetyltransferase